MIILALDALDLSVIKKLNCKNLMQEEFGQTDISDFNLERTIVLWASFLSGKNMENDIPIKNQWEFQMKKDETFFKFFDSFKAIDVPAFCYKQENHKAERKLLEDYFHNKASVEEYDDVVWKNHEENKEEFFDSVGKSDLVMG